MLLCVCSVLVKIYSFLSLMPVSAALVTLLTIRWPIVYVLEVSVKTESNVTDVMKKDRAVFNWVSKVIRQLRLVLVLVLVLLQFEVS